MPFRFLPRSFRDIPLSAILLPLATLAVIAAIVFWGDSIPIQSWLKLPQKDSASEKPGMQPLKERTSRIRGVVQPGQTLSAILEGFQLAPVQAGLIREAARPYGDLNRLQPGNEYYVTTGEHGELRSFEYYTDVEHLLKVTEKGDAFAAQLFSVPFTLKAVVRSGAIVSSLNDSLTAAGVDAKTARDFADIFAGEVNFALDMAHGATWRMLYEEKWRDGRLQETGRILAAEIVNKGRKYEAIYFEGTAGRGGYYTPEGETVRRMFLKSPLGNGKTAAAQEIGPGVKGRKKAPSRLGLVELIAPAGTPVETVAEGRVISSGSVKGRGKTVVLRHQDGFVARYAHLASVARGIRRGARVSQGAVIGHVGATGKKGRSYLEFAMQKGKRPIDPLNLPDLPAGRVAPGDMQHFLTLVGERTDRMSQTTAQGAAPPTVSAGARELP